jgi:hypothetical protein
VLRMLLQHRTTCAHHFAALASQVSWPTHVIPSSSCRRQLLTPLKCSLPGWLPGSVDIEDHMALSLSIPHASNGLFRPLLPRSVFWK